MSNDGPTVEQAALNNAAWCDAVCASHGLAGSFDAAAWSMASPAPPYYPNMVTLAAGADVEAEQLLRVREIVDAVGQGHEIGIKDSFCRLDLTPLDFEPRIKAEWYALTGTAPVGATAEIEIVRDEATLLAWERAWSASSPGSTRMFRPGLLARDDVLFLAERREGRIEAGVIANLAAGVVGVSNLFGPTGNARALVTSAVGAIRDRFGDLPIVGYAGGDGLRFMESLGCERLGPVRVWIRRADCT
jgi:hypothetical protein